MDLVKMQHPSGLTTEVPASAVGQHALAGWVVDESETPPDCPACGQSWPVPKQDPAPAESGASSSEKATRRRRQSEESD